MTLLERERVGFRARLTDHLALAAGTEQGLFLISDGTPDGPFFKGCQIPGFLQLGSRYYVAVGDRASGPSLCLSDDGGRTWSRPSDQLVAFPPEAGAVLAAICQIQADRSRPGAGDAAVLVGVVPAALFRSADGISFELVRGLWDLPNRPAWQASPLHTILTHRERPGRIIVAIGDGGVYRSDDGGETWQARSGGIAMRPAGPLGAPRRGVHKVALDAGNPDVLLAQTDTGTYRSEDAGDSWARVGRAGEAGGIASDFGFPVVTHPRVAGEAYVFPLESEAYPYSPGGRPRVYRTTDGGLRWGVLGEGLPHENAYLTVLSDAFTVGQSSPYPLVFGTRAGQIFASVDHGDRWRLVASGLPPVLSVRVLE